MNTHASPESRSIFSRGITAVTGPALPFLFLAVIFFGGSFWRGEQFVFRDAAHFYYPLFHEVARQWKSGEVPLWSPYDGIGMPLAADATSSVFYPAKLLLLGPWGFDHGMRLYVLIHYLLAYVGAYSAARRWRCSQPAASLAAVSYAFGGPLLAYHANVVFLVGAAWLPWAVGYGWKLVRQPQYNSALGLAVCLAMMVLGGDPQMAYHTVLVLSLAAFLFALRLRGSADWRTWFHQRLVRIGAVAGSAVVAIALTAIQIFPSSEWADRSERAVSGRPRNIYELAVEIASPSEAPLQSDALRGMPPPGTHVRYGYDFSIAPWNWPETFLSNFSGRMYPRHERWTRAIPADGRIWLPSLFIGTITTVLAAVGLIRKGRRRVDRWLATVSAWGLLASLGWYGAGWIALEIGNATGWYSAESLPVGSPFGGLYWLMTVLLPEYVSFRYPGKWWIFVAMAASFLAGRGLDEVCRAPGGVKRAMTALAAATGGFGLLLGLAAEWLALRLPEVKPDVLFGPLDAKAAFFQAALGMLQASIVLLLAAVVLGKAAVVPRHWLLVMLVAADLGLGNRGVIVTAPQSLWHIPVPEERLPEPTPSDPLPGVYRSRSLNFYPQRFQQQASGDRQIKGLEIDRSTLFPRYHLLEPVRSVPSVLSIMPLDYRLVWEEADTPRLRGLLCDMLGARKFYREPGVDGVDVVENADAWPAAWWQHDVQWRPAVEAARPAALRRETGLLLEQLSAETDAARPLILEGEPQQLTSEFTDLLSGETVVDYSRKRSGEITIGLQGARPGWLIVREYFDSGWQARVLSEEGKMRPVPIVRANRIMMAVPIAAHDTRVVLRYQPKSFVFGAYVSALAWIVIASTGLYATWSAARRRWAARSGS